MEHVYVQTVGQGLVIRSYSVYTMYEYVNHVILCTNYVRIFYLQWRSPTVQLLPIHRLALLIAR
jgi:hypothetical protein